MEDIINYPMGSKISKFFRSNSKKNANQEYSTNSYDVQHLLSDTLFQLNLEKKNFRIPSEQEYLIFLQKLIRNPTLEGLYLLNIGIGNDMYPLFTKLQRDGIVVMLVGKGLKMREVMKLLEPCMYNLEENQVILRNSKDVRYHWVIRRFQVYPDRVNIGDVCCLCLDDIVLGRGKKVEIERGEKGRYEKGFMLCLDCLKIIHNECLGFKVEKCPYCDGMNVEVLR